MDFGALARQFGTPLFIYDFDEIAARYNAIKSQFSARKSLVCYAVKANSNLSVLKHLAGLGAGFDCVSIGEVKRALIAGASSYKIIYSGVAKSPDDIKEALKLNILMINVESPAELALVEKIAAELNKPAQISIRVNPNVDPKTHPYISTGLAKNKFGVSLDDAKKMYLKAHKSAFLDPVGIHFHIGSQLLDIAPIHEAAQIVSRLTDELLAAGLNIRFFDCGGGLGVRYSDESEPDLYAYAQGILAALNGKDLTIITEPGRYIVANGGTLLSSVLYEKQNGPKRFVICDAAMNDLIRPSLYGAYHAIELVTDGAKTGDSDSAKTGGDDGEACGAIKEGGEPTLCDVVGGVCESGDFLGKDITLPPTKMGDLLAIKSAGAYGFSMSSNYNSRPRPAEVAIEAGRARLIRKKEDFDEMIASERELL